MSHREEEMGGGGEGVLCQKINLALHVLSQSYILISLTMICLLLDLVYVKVIYVDFKGEVT